MLRPPNLRALLLVFMSLYFGLSLGQPADSIRASRLVQKADTTSDISLAVGYYLSAADQWESLSDGANWRKAIVGAARRYNREGLADSAIVLLQRSLNDPNWPPPAIRARTQKSLGYYLDISNRKVEARDVLESARAYYESQPALTTHDARYVYKTLGNIYTQLGEYDRAIGLLQQAARVFEDFGDIGGYLQARSDLAVAYDFAFHPDSSLMIYEELVEFDLPAPDLQLLYRTNQATALLKLGRVAEAGQTLRSAGKWVSTAQEVRYLAGYWMAYLDFYDQSGKKNRAAAAIDSVLALSLRFPEFANSREMAKFRVNLGQRAFKNGRYQQALQYYQSALAPFVVNFDQDSIWRVIPVDQLPTENTVMEALAGKGRAAFEISQQTSDRKQLNRSLDFLEAAIAVEGQLRGEFTFESSGLSLADWVYALHADALNVAWTLTQAGEENIVERAFRIAEDNRAATLALSLKKRGLQDAGLSPKWGQNERHLRRQLNRARQLLFEAQKSGAGTDSLDKLNLQLFRIREAYENHLGSAPASLAANYAPRRLDIGEVQNRLSSQKETLISFFAADSVLYAFRLDGKSMVWESLPYGSQQKGWLQQLLDQLRGTGFDCPAFAEAGSRLFEVWLSPLLGKEIPGKLVIVADGWLNYLPFEVLLTAPVPKPEACDFRSLDWFWRRTQIRYQYAASFLLQGSSRSGLPSPKLAAIAPNYDPAGMSGVNSPAVRDAQFGPLSFNEPEARAIADIWNGDLWTGAEATRRVFEDSASGYDLLHLAMHAYTYDEAPLFSGLVFGADYSSERRVLHAHEIHRLPLKARLVVLSACNTGSGQLVRGEGVMSLGRAFRSAGSPSLLMSLWRVNDAPTAQIMTSFHQALQRGNSTTQALQKAREEFLSQAGMQTAHPRNWAAFILLGEDIRFGGRIDLWRLALLVIMAFLVLGFLWPEGLGFSPFPKW